MTTGKTIALTRRTFVGKVMSLLLNMLSILYTSYTYIVTHFIAIVTEIASLDAVLAVSARQ